VDWPGWMRAGVEAIYAPAMVWFAMQTVRLAARQSMTKDGRQDGPPPGVPVLLSFNEACEVLRMSDKALRAEIAAGKLRALKPRHQWLIRAGDLNAYLEAHTDHAPMPITGDRLRCPAKATRRNKDAMRPWERILAEDAERRRAEKEAKRLPKR
jgi:excisionase family DNA binding protein